MIFYKHFLGDYRRDTGHLSMLEHGAYRLLLDAFYATEKPLPLEPRRLYRLVGAVEAAERAAVDAVLEEFWERAQDGWTNARAAVELETQQERSDKARASAMRRHMRTQVRTHSEGTSERSASQSQSLLTPTKVGGPNKPDSDLTEAIDIFNRMAGEARIPTVQRLTDKRRRALRQRLAECGGLEGWKAACERVRASRFLTGDNDRGWCANIDFMLRQSSFTSLMEGAYEAGNGTNALSQVERLQREGRI